jgi:hypothetical protein
MQARLVHAEDIAQGTIGDTLFALEQCHHPQEHGVELSLGLGLLASAWLRGGGCSGPDEDRALLIHSQSLPRHEFKLQILKRFIIQRELALEQAVRHAPAPLQQRHGLVYHLCKRHGGPSPSLVTPCPLSVRFTGVPMP